MANAGIVVKRIETVQRVVVEGGDPTVPGAIPACVCPGDRVYRQDTDQSYVIKADGSLEAGVGSAGPAGPPGVDGAAGPQGPQGNQGPPGNDGAAGPQGLPGADGAQGPQGVQGLPGSDGAAGAQGPAGADGAQGIQGIQGPPGADGAQGIQGLPGADGAQGPQGIQGPQGEPGVGGFTFPIGYILISAVNTNPATFIGYGTWANVGAGRVLVGLDSGDADFDTVGETGGAKTVTLTTAQLPAHNHQILRERSATTGGATTLIARTSDTSSTVDTNVFTANAGSGEAHPNMPPYLVTYFWQRTA